MTLALGRADRTVAVVAHGAGSCGAVAASIFRAIDLQVDDVVAVEDRAGDVAAVERALARAVARAGAERARVRFVGGVSLGAHAAVRWACTDPLPPGLEGLLLVMPAWTGPPGPVAALTGAAADEVASLGPAAVVDRLRSDPGTRDDWVVAALADGWASYDTPGLVAALRSAAGSPGPDLAAMAAVAVPAGIAALEGDPLHPAQVAAQWAETLPRAAMVRVERHAPAAGRGLLGAAAWQAWRATGSR